MALKFMTKKLLPGAALFLGLLPTASAQNQYSNWLYSGSLHILTTPAGANLAASASVTNFPLLVRLNPDFFTFSQAKSDGSDIRFATPDGTNLSYQIDEWNSARGTASLWVRIPVIRGNTNQELKMYWGRADATNESSGPAVFNSTNGYVSVMHMTDPTQDAVGTLAPVNVGSTAGTGMIGPARHFVAGQGIRCGTAITNFPKAASAHSSEAWFRADAANNTLVGWGLEQGQGKVVMQLASPPHINMDCYFSGANVAGRSTLALSQWYHVAHTYKNGEARLYINGVQDGITTGGTALNIPAASRMYLGGWYDNYNFAGDLDEVRISNVTRSSNWIKMEYESQKPLQTMTGTLVPPASTFSVSPAQVTMNEGTTTNVTGEAGGAQKVYWLSQSGGQDTILSVDRLSCTVAAGRVSGDQSFVLQFKAVYPAGIQTHDIPVTITESIPDPAFTLTASTHLWDGRQPMTVTATVTNWSALQAAGVTNLTYAWSLAGVAVTKTIANPTLTLLRSQGSGPMTVKLVLHNGGALLTHTVAVTVQEPPTDAWVVRTPGATEKAVNNQFYARDDTGYGTIHYHGTGAGSPDYVFLKVFTNGSAGDVLFTNLTQVLSGGAYAFSVRIPSGLVKYSVQCGSVTGTTTNSLGTATNLVCGDAYLIEGQSNAVATDGLPSETTTSPWIRTYGGSGGGWGSAVRNGTQWWIGYWGMDLATNLVASCGIPICIINGAVGGTRIDQHQANPANHYVPDSHGNAIYANLLNRVAGANLTHGIRAILWHQGENNSAADSPTGAWDYLSYQQYFVDMSAAWKQDYPNVRHYYIFQVWPNPCSMGGKESSDMLREVQRTLPRLFSNLRVMSTLGLSGYLGCHFSAAGYRQIATVIAPLVKQDNYGFVPTSAITAPDVKRAYFTTASRNQIALEFGQDMVWNTAATANFYLDRIPGRVISGSASGKVLKLQVTGATTNRTIGYVVDEFWGGSSANLIKGANGIAALTFYAVPIESPPVCALTNLPATGLAPNSAALNAALACTGTVYHVMAYWNTVNGGTSAGLWTNSAYLGAWGDSVSTNLTYTATDLAPNQTYYFTFRATNDVYNVWASSVQSFTNLPPPPILPVSGVSVSNGVPHFTFPAVAEYKYRLDYKNALPDAAWLPVIAPPDFPLPDGWSATSTGTPISLSDTNAVGQPQRFYRLEVATP
jgi:hypothetical protein